MIMIRLRMLLVVLLILVCRQGATGDWTNPEDQVAAHVPRKDPTTTTTTTSTTAHHQPPQHPPFLSSSNLKRLFITQPKKSLSRTASYYIATQNIYLSLSASHNLTSTTTPHNRRSPTLPLLHPSSRYKDVVLNAAQRMQQRRDEIAAIVSLAGMTPEEVPWLALRLEGLARITATMDVYEDVVVPAAKIGVCLLVRRLIPEAPLYLLVGSGMLFGGSERGITSQNWEKVGELEEKRMTELRYLETKGDMTPWMMVKEVVYLDRTAYGVAIQECKSRSGVAEMPKMCFFAENVTEAGWIWFRLTWSVVVLGLARSRCRRDRGWRKFVMALSFFAVVYYLPEIVVTVGFEVM